MLTNRWGRGDSDGAACKLYRELPWFRALWPCRCPHCCKFSDVMACSATPCFFGLLVVSSLKCTNVYSLGNVTQQHQVGTERGLSERPVKCRQCAGTGVAGGFQLRSLFLLQFWFSALLQLDRRSPCVSAQIRILLLGSQELLISTPLCPSLGKRSSGQSSSHGNWWQSIAFWEHSDSALTTEGKKKASVNRLRVAISLICPTIMYKIRRKSMLGQHMSSESNSRPGVAARTSNPSMWETETNISSGQSELHMETLPPSKNKMWRSVHNPACLALEHMT